MFYDPKTGWVEENFPSFLEGLSLRLDIHAGVVGRDRGDFPSFLEGLSLRLADTSAVRRDNRDFPSFLEGLSIRQINIPLRMTTGPFVLYLEV